MVLNLSSNFSLQIKQIFAFLYDFCWFSLLITFFFSFLKLIISFAYFLKDLGNLSLFTSCLLSIYLNDDIVDAEKPNGICSPTFVAHEFSGLFLHPSVFFIKVSITA